MRTFLIVLIILLILLFIKIYNDLNKVLIKINESISSIDVALLKRHDSLTLMVDLIKSYITYERENLLKIIEIRNDMNLEEKKFANKDMISKFKQINVIAESHPDLKSDKSFKTLQLIIANSEEHLQAARRMYNANVSKYNQMLAMFPTNIVAKIFKLKNKDFFEIDETKIDININL